MGVPTLWYQNIRKVYSVVGVRVVQKAFFVNYALVRCGCRKNILHEVCCREIKDMEDTLKLQKNIDRQEMRYEISTSQMQHDAADKEHNKIQASYTLEGTVLENVKSIKYLGVTITSDLKWNSHIRNVCSKANRTLGFLRRNLFSCPQDVKEAAYKSLVPPILEYGSTVWDPHCNGLNDELDVQKRAARFVTRNYSYETGSLTGILEELKW